MPKLTSLNKKNNFKEKLDDLCHSIDDFYYTLKEEIEDEILGVRKEQHIIHDETLKIYKKLDNKKCTKIIKKVLPLRNRIFSNVKVSGYGMKNSTQIEISFYFGINTESFNYLIGVEKIKQLLGDT